MTLTWINTHANLVRTLRNSDEIKSHSFRDNADLKTIGLEAFTSEQVLENMELLKDEKNFLFYFIKQ